MVGTSNQSVPEMAIDFSMGMMKIDEIWRFPKMAAPCGTANFQRHG